ncbi:MAG: hypothetical protein WD063_09790 [Pirellulales bacterium]
MRFTAYLLAAVAAMGASTALAQSGASGANVTIQLPNFSVFGVNTTVLVPDSGPSPLARERQAQYSRAMYGRFHPQRAIGAARQAAVASATAQIHDPRAADEIILRAARARRTNWVRGSTSPFDRRAQPAGRGLQSVADIERQRALESAADRREALSLLENARQARDAGKGGVAAIYYRMAANKATGELQQDIRRETRTLKAAATVPDAKPVARSR